MRRVAWVSILVVVGAVAPDASAQPALSPAGKHSAITLREGKLALGLAKSKLRPGDVVEVRTPNAIAGIRPKR